MSVKDRWEEQYLRPSTETSDFVETVREELNESGFSCI